MYIVIMASENAVWAGLR